MNKSKIFMYKIGYIIVKNEKFNFLQTYMILKTASFTTTFH